MRHVPPILSLDYHPNNRTEVQIMCEASHILYGGTV